MNKNLKLLVTTSSIAAIVLLLGLTSLGIIPLGFINVTILCIPVIVGVLTLGLKAGVIIGTCFGLASTLRAFGIPVPASALASTLCAAQPLYVVLMSMIPRICVPIVSYLLYRLLAKADKYRIVSPLSKVADHWAFIILFPAVLIALYGLKVLSFGWVLLLFALYAVFELLFATASEKSRSIVCAAAGSLTNTILYLGLMLLFYTLCGIDNSTVLGLITGTGIIGGGCEAIAAAILCPPIIAALKKAHLSFITEN